MTPLSACRVVVVKALEAMAPGSLVVETLTVLGGTVVRVGDAAEAELDAAAGRDRLVAVEVALDAGAAGAEAVADVRRGRCPRPRRCRTMPAKVVVPGNVTSMRLLAAPDSVPLPRA